jgi:riboflavin kinase/FMN adenylyltransferase
VPTANIPFSPRGFIPKRGVWAVACDVEGIGNVTGVANVGVRPTVEDGGEENCEVHFFCPMPDLYGKRVCVRYLHFIRPEIAFSDLAALAARIDLDKQIAKEYFDRWNGQN